MVHLSMAMMLLVGGHNVFQMMYKRQYGIFIVLVCPKAVAFRKLQRNQYYGQNHPPNMEVGSLILSLVHGSRD